MLFSIGLNDLGLVQMHLTPPVTVEIKTEWTKLSRLDACKNDKTISWCGMHASCYNIHSICEVAWERGRCAQNANSRLGQGSMFARCKQSLGARIDVCKMQTVAWAGIDVCKMQTIAWVRSRCVQMHTVASDKDRCVQDANSRLGKGSMCARCTQLLGAGIDMCKMQTVAWAGVDVCKMQTVAWAGIDV